MQFFNLKVPQQKVSFAEAIKLGLGKEQGLFMPETILQRTLDSQVEELMNKSFVERSIDILAPFVESDIPRADFVPLLIFQLSPLALMKIATSTYWNFSMVHP